MTENNKLILKSSIQAIRAYQWPKNLLIFFPLIFNHHLLNWPSFFQLTVSFIFFSFIASAGYIFNDLLDISNDRLHPEKSKRPFASNSLKISYGIKLGSLLLILSLLGSSQFNQSLFIMSSSYFIVMMIYSLILKKIIFIDILCLGFFYTIRIMTGAIILGIAIPWYYLALSFFFFSGLGSLKRLIDLAQLQQKKPAISLFAITNFLITLVIFSTFQQNLYSKRFVFLAIGVIAISYWIYNIFVKISQNIIKTDFMKYVLSDTISIICISIFFTSIIIASNYH